MQIDTPLLPLGSVVCGAGGETPLMIVARALMLDLDGEVAYFDYGACVYPEGMIGDSMLYFNAEDITEVVHEGFTDDQDVALLESIRDIASTANLVKGDTQEFRQRAHRIYEQAVASND